MLGRFLRDGFNGSSGLTGLTGLTGSSGLTGSTDRKWGRPPLMRSTSHSPSRSGSQILIRSGSQSPSRKQQQQQQQQQQQHHHLNGSKRPNPYSSCRTSGNAKISRTLKSCSKMNFSPNSKYNLSDIDETGRLNFSDVDDFDDLSFYLRRDKVDFLIEIFF